MACITYAVIRGEKDLNKYCLKRWKDTPRFVESFAHNIFGVYIERIYEKGPHDNGYQQYYILGMETSKETGFYHYDDIRRKVHEDIRADRIALLRV